MAPMGFVPEAVTNVFRSPFFRKSTKSTRKAAATPESPQPQVGSSASAVLQSSPRVVGIENHPASLGVENVKEPDDVSAGKYASMSSLASATNVTETPPGLASMVEQSNLGMSFSVSPLQKINESTSCAPDYRNSFDMFSFPTSSEKPNTHTSDSPARRVDSSSASGLNDSIKNISFSSFGSPYPPTVSRMTLGPSADLSTSEDEQSVAFATPPVSPDLSCEQSAEVSASAVVLVSPPSDRDVVSSSNGAPWVHGPRLSDSDSTRPPASTRSSTVYTQTSGDTTSFPATPLETPSSDSRTGPVALCIGENTIEPIGIPLPVTYAEATNLAVAFPEIGEELLKRPLGPSRTPSRAPSADGRPTPSPAPTSDADDADDERSEIRSPLRRVREHSTDHPNWAVAPEGERDRKTLRGRGRDRPNERQHQNQQEAAAAQGRERERNRRRRGRKSAVATAEREDATPVAETDNNNSLQMARLKRLIEEARVEGRKAEWVNTGSGGSAGINTEPVDAGSDGSNGIETEPVDADTRRHDCATSMPSDRESCGSGYDVSDRTEGCELKKAEKTVAAASDVAKTGDSGIAGSVHAHPRLRDDVVLAEGAQKLTSSTTAVDSRESPNTVRSPSTATARTNASAEVENLDLWMQELVSTVLEAEKDEVPLKMKPCVTDDQCTLGLSGTQETTTSGITTSTRVHARHDKPVEGPTEISQPISESGESKRTVEAPPASTKALEGLQVQETREPTNIWVSESSEKCLSDASIRSLIVENDGVPKAPDGSKLHATAYASADKLSHSLHIEPHTATEARPVFSPFVEPFIPSAAAHPQERPYVKLPAAGQLAAPFSALAPEFLPGKARMPVVPSHVSNITVPDTLSTLTSVPSLTTASSPFVPFAENPAAAAIVNIANHANLTAGGLSKRASVANLSAALPHPSFVRPMVNVAAAPPPSFASAALPPAFVGSLAQEPSSIRQHHRRGSTASLVATPFAPQQIHAPIPTRAGLSKRSSIACLHATASTASARPFVPSPLVKRPPVHGGHAVSATHGSAVPVFTPQLVDVPNHRAHSRRASIVAAAPPVVPRHDLSVSSHSGPMAVPPLQRDPSQAMAGSYGQLKLGSPVNIAVAAPPVFPFTDWLIAAHDSPRRPSMPVGAESSPASAWTPATRPVAPGPALTMAAPARHCTMGGTLAGYDEQLVVPAGSMGTRRVHHVSFGDGVTSSDSPSALQVTPASDGLTTGIADRHVGNATAECMDSSSPIRFPTLPTNPSTPDRTVSRAPLEPETIYSTPPKQASSSACVRNVAPEIVSVQSLPVRDLLEPELPSRPVKVCIEVDDGVGDAGDDHPEAAMKSEPSPVRLPTPCGQISLATVIGDTRLGMKDVPVRPTSVVPDIHAGTSDDPVHWTIDELGKLRAKKTDQEGPSPPSETVTAPQPQGPSLPPRKRLGQEQPAAYKPYFQNAGPPPSAQPNARFAGLRRRSMIFARGEGGVRDEGANRGGSPDEARGAAGLRRQGSGMWRKKFGEAGAHEDEQQKEEEPVDTLRRGRERKKTLGGWRCRGSPTLGADAAE